MNYKEQYQSEEWKYFKDQYFSFISNIENIKYLNEEQYMFYKGKILCPQCTEPLINTEIYNPFKIYDDDDRKNEFPIIHHNIYIKNLEIWKYPLSLLTPMHYGCHNLYHNGTDVYINGKKDNCIVDKYNFDKNDIFIHKIKDDLFSQNYADFLYKKMLYYEIN